MSRGKIPRLHVNMKPAPPPKKALPKEKVKKKKGDESYSDEEKVRLASLVDHPCSADACAIPLSSLGGRRRTPKNGTTKTTASGRFISERWRWVSTRIEGRNVVQIVACACSSRSFRSFVFASVVLPTLVLL